MTKPVSADDKRLIVRLQNGDEVLLESVHRGDGRSEVAITMTNGQTVRNCFWLNTADNQVIVDVDKVRRLIQFVHARNQPAYQRILNWARSRLPKWVVQMSGRTMLLCYASIPVVGRLMMPVLGRTSWTVLGLYTTLVMIVTLGFTEQEIDLGIDFRQMESVATRMLGASGAVRGEPVEP